MGLGHEGRIVLVLLAVCTADVAAAQPANDDCANATLVTSLPFVDSVDMTTATTELGDPVSTCGGQGTNSIWYRIPAGSDATLLRGLVAGSGTDYGVRAWTGSCGALVELECEFLDDFFTDFGFAAEGQEYLIEIVNLATPGTLDLTLDVFPEFLVAKGGSRRNAIGGGPGGFLVGIPKFPVAEGRLYDPTGSALGPAFPLGSLSWPFDVAGAGDGSFVVVGNSSGARAVRVDGVGLLTELPGVAASGDVAADANGNFVVVRGFTPVVAQRYDRDGVPQGSLVQVTSFGRYPSVAMAPSGDFVVTWTGDDGDGEGIEAQRYDASGTPVGSAFVVNTHTTQDQDAPAVAMDAAGNFVVAWDDCCYQYFPGEGGFDEPVVARRFAADGTPLGPDFVVSDNRDYYGVTSYIHVAMAGNGEFMVTWEGYPGGVTVVDIHARRFAADGTPAGSEFFVNTFQNGYSSYDPDVAATPAGDFMVAWNDYRGFFREDIPPDFENEATLARLFPASGLACAPAALAGCRTPTVPLKAKMLLLDASDALHDQLRWKFVKGEATDAADLGDPTASEDYALCMYDASNAGGALLMENRIPAGGICGTKPCWKGLGNPPGTKGYRYKSKDRTPHGILKMIVKPGPDGKSKIVVKGGQDHVFTAGPGAPPLPLPLPVTVQLQNRSGQCWQATYDAEGVGVNEAGFYKGSGS